LESEILSANENVNLKKPQNVKPTRVNVFQISCVLRKLRRYDMVKSVISHT